MNDVAPGDRGARGGAPLRTCSACGRSYGDAAWRALAISERLEASHVRGFVSRWPEGLVVEVRTCGGCGGAIAAKGPARHRAG